MAIEAEDRGVRKWLRSMRVRIVGLLVLLLLVSSLGSLLLLRAALFTSLERDVEASLSREVEEFQRLSGGSDPRRTALRGRRRSHLRHLLRPGGPRRG